MKHPNKVKVHRLTEARKWIGPVYLVINICGIIDFLIGLFTVGMFLWAWLTKGLESAYQYSWATLVIAIIMWVCVVLSLSIRSLLDHMYKKVKQLNKAIAEGDE